MGWDDYMHMPVHAFLAIGNILAKQLKDEAEKEEEAQKGYSSQIPSIPNLPNLSSFTSGLNITHF